MPGSFRHLCRDLGKVHPLRRGEKKHLQTLRFQADFGQQLLGIVDPSFSTEITFQVMTGTLQSAGDENGVGSLLKGL